MENPYEETSKRLKIAEEQVQRFKDISKGIILVGSVAYSPNFNVTKNSDLDMLIIVDDLKKTLPLIISEASERKALQNRVFEGYCIKEESNNVPVSLHILSEDSFDIISKCFVADIRVYRPEGKDGIYNLKGFEGNIYPYKIKNIKLNDLEGFRTIVPISFISQDRFYIGVHRDKLLSHPKILYDNGTISGKVDKLWKTVSENLYDESVRLYGKLDLEKMNVVNALNKKERMSSEVIQDIKEKTKFYISKFK
ncbi:MAG: hypothetical protein PHE43_00370 [Candidatus Nanoarchaeia archaeon]|nr:hypothetical protein [Candidatus Nanoarchaeia archaeon]